MIVCAVQRDEAFSPNSVAADKAILLSSAERVGDVLQARTEFLQEKDLATWMDSYHNELTPRSVVWLTMARRDDSIECLRQREILGDMVINSPKGVSACRRGYLHRLMLKHHMPVAPSSGHFGYWLKRGDQAAQTINDVVFAEDEREMRQRLDEFHNRGVEDVVVSAHIPGDLLKFYGVAGTDFFRIYYPTADGVSKFGNERRNGFPHYYEFDRERLIDVVDQIAALTGTQVYGGDAIVDEDGKFYIIDFNDWPSFSRCKSEAADAIKTLVERISK